MYFRGLCKSLEQADASKIIEDQAKECEDDNAHVMFVLNGLVPFRERFQELYLSCD